MTTPTQPAGDSARARLARLHVGMTSHEARQHALGMADLLERRAECVAPMVGEIAALRDTLAVFVETARHADDLLASGRSGAARRFLKKIAAYVPAEPSGPSVADVAPDWLPSPAGSI